MSVGGGFLTFLPLPNKKQVTPMMIKMNIPILPPTILPIAEEDNLPPPVD
jgi:hypothetical protein